MAKKMFDKGLQKNKGLIRRISKIGLIKGIKKLILLTKIVKKS
jgi:hypothetical protein